MRKGWVSFFCIFGSFDCFVFFSPFFPSFFLPFFFLFFLFSFSFQSVRRGYADQTMGFGF